MTAPAMDPFVRSFGQLAEASPAALAVLDQDRRVTRAELDTAGREGAERLAQAGIGPGDAVGLRAAPGPGFVAAFLALRRVGACALLLDPGTGEADVRRTLAGLPVRYLWSIPDGSPWPGRSLPESLGGGLSGVSTSLAAIKLSSGSSGAPVGIGVRADQLLADGRQIASSMGLRADDRILSVIPFSHSYGFSVLVTPLLLLGSPLLIPGVGDPWALAREHGATVLPSVPAWFRAQLRGQNSELGAQVRLFVSAGAPLVPELAREWRERVGRPIQVLYGSSECGSITFDRDGGAAERGSVGTALDGVEIELAGEGDARHVRVRSAAVAEGYLPEDPARASRLADGRFDTEDLGVWAAAGASAPAELRLLGRRSAWINVNGKKVDPVEVEQTLRDLPGVEEVAVLGKPLGDGRGEAVRAVIACPGGGLDYGSVSAWCRARLAPYKVPRSIVLVPSLPRTERGKLDRKALLEI